MAEKNNMKNLKKRRVELIGNLLTNQFPLNYLDNNV